jgi:hypothetical protein
MFAKAREVAHNVIAVVGVIAGAQALIVAFLAQLGLSSHAAQASYVIGGAGAAAVLLSKLIDSVNNALTSPSSTTSSTSSAPLRQPPQGGSTL